MYQQHKEKSVYKNTTLYSVVFDSWYIKCGVFSLFILLLTQPIAPALAFFETNELAQNDTFLSEEIVLAQTDTSIASADVQASSSSLPTAEIENTEVPAVTNASIEISQNATTSISTTATTTTSATVSSSTSVTSLVESTTTVPLFVSTSTTYASTTYNHPVVVDQIITNIVQEEALIQPTLASSSASSSVEKITVAETVHNSAAFEFDTKECAVVGNGAYYCSSPKESIDVTKDGVFSLPDSGGDLEIYVRVAGKETIITNNSVDDSAPYYDSQSDRIVWHRLVHDRYQIVSYDMKKNIETYLTDTEYNNMEPMAYGEITLWQAWIDNNWEIVLNDGATTRQITLNTEQDVSPHIRGGYIVWQTQFVDGWKVAVYDQKTRKTEYIASEGGLKVENPRFVLVYDSTDGNGDVQTVGYDFDTKSTFALGSLPAQLPDKLPDPDQTGETRALTQAKQTSKEGESESNSIPQDTNDATGSSTVASSTVGTLDLSQTLANASSSVSTPASATAPIITDVIVQSYASSTPASQEVIVIPDVVIPPYISTSTLEIS